jgi:hypothetical protein
MDALHVTLYVHIIALVVAGSAATVVKLAIGRRKRARTVADALDWHNVMASTSKLFPICLAVFVISGAYMLSLTHAPWSTGFVVAGLVGAALLLVNGVLLGVKGKAVGQRLEAMAKENPTQPAPKGKPPLLVAMLPMVNTGIGLSVAFDMVTKPDSVGVALAVLVVGIVLGAALSMRHPAPAVERVEA